jgi:hypothetical protein
VEIEPEALSAAKPIAGASRIARARAVVERVVSCIAIQ